MQSLWMLFAAFSFSLMGVGVKLASEFYTTGEIVFYRSLIGVTIMWIMLASQGISVRTPHMVTHIKRSLFGVTALLLWFTSITLLPLATAMTLNYMSPVWIALILGASAALAGTAGSADKKLIGAILLSFAGVICLLQPSVGKDQLTGGMIGLISGMFTALAYVEVRQLGQLGEPEGRIVFYFSAVGLVCGLVWMLYSGMSPLTWHGVGLLLAIGILATLGQTTMTRAYKRGNTLLTANLQYAGIVFSSLWGTMVWDDKLNWISWLGMALIVASGIATTLTRARDNDKHPTPATPVKSPEAEVHPEV
ncbi:DMT family transporter [Cupriavidus pauculus]|uniref:DMT family transporter n=1 Tax=Cupriavidus pauculus TaxID=82633 RepID=UPI0012490283|nr:DMT family transporter [Cupriavidus pauculus]KAB0596036.1 DMT family transporter [Cupriavidus pauculus]MCM3608239.1 DMT family transporter [Cupriavidus pauculus]UAL00390.1 DMT family transporter [Cupriavidus pauculus]